MPGLLLLKDLLEKIQWYSGCSFWSAVVGISFNVISYPWVYQFSISSVTQSCSTLCNLINRSTPGLRVHHKLPESTQTHVHWVSDATQPSHALSSPSPPALNLSQHQGLFQRIRWPKYWSFSFIISPSSEESGLISFRIDWFDLLAVQVCDSSIFFSSMFSPQMRMPIII